MDDGLGSLVTNVGSESPVDGEESIERTPVREVFECDSQGNRHPDEASAAHSVHQETFVANSPTRGDSGDEADIGETTSSLSGAHAHEQDTNDNDFARGDLPEVSDEGEAESHESDHDMMEAILGATMRASNDHDNPDDYTLSSSYLTEVSASSSDSGRDRHASTGTPRETTDIGQLLEHPMREYFVEAIKQGRIERVNELLVPDPQLSNLRLWVEPDYEGQEAFMTPLCLAVTCGQSRVLEALLQNEAHVDMLSTHIDGGISALHIAAIMGNYTSVRLLLSQGASINIKRADGTTPLHDAIKQQNVAIVECLLYEGADTSMRDDEQNSAFHLASAFDCVKILDLLWAASSNAQIAEVFNSSHAPIHIASLKNCPTVVRWLLNKGADVNQIDDNNRTPLHLASMEGNNSVVWTLLENDAQVESLDSESRTPLLLACLNLQGEVMKTLFYRYASTTAVDSGGRGCLHLVIEGHYSAPEDFEAHPEYLEYLVGRGAVVDHLDNRGSTPLMDACQCQNRQLIATLLDLGADINRQGHMNRTPVFYACEKPDTGSLDLLLRRGADVTVAMTGGSTPLHTVCSWGIIDNVRELLKYNAPVTALDGDGNTPLFKAADGGFVGIMLELVKTREYFPENLAVDKAFIEPPRKAATIVRAFSKGFEENMYYFNSDLQPLLHWAVSQGRFELIRKRLKYKPEALFWKMDGGATWLHVAAQYGHSGIINNLFGEIDATKEARGAVTALHIAATRGHLDTARALLQIIAKDFIKADEACCAKATAIICWNNQRESPLTLSVSRKHKHLEELFFSELHSLGSVSGSPLDAIKGSELLEILAEWEKPGRESVLKYLLESWLPAPPQTEVRHWSALHWAVHGSTAVVVWWLLSKGGYRSGDAIRDCQREPLVRTDAIGVIIQNLLRNPPQQMYEIANPVDDEPPFLPRPTDWTDQRLDLHGFIMSVYFQNENTVVPYTRDTLHGIIYSHGPNALTRGVELLEQRDLNILKAKLGDVSSENQSLPNIWNLSRAPSGDYGRIARLRLPRYDYSAINCAENLRLRWIHLPVNELQLTKDLVTRLSHDSGRSEMEHRNLMKFFNSSWTELAAGAKQHYMKPRAVIDEADKNRNRIAVYMPYLTLGEYDSAQTNNQAISGLKQNRNDGLIGRRDSRHIAHTPLTLDQYYYPGVSETSDRDDTQVFSKYLEKHPEKSLPSASRIHLRGRSKKKRILMVDQVWIWIIDDQSIITSTAQRPDESSTASPQDLKDSSMSTLLHHVLNDIAYGESKGRFERPNSVNAVKELVLGAATGFFIEKCVQLADSTFKGPLEVFRESIRDVADRETKLFQRFFGHLNDEIEKRKMRTEQISSNSGRPSIRELPNNPYHIISEETELLHQIRDINDELHMLRSLAEDQEIVWNQAFAGIETQACFSCTPAEIARDLDGMILEAEMARDSIDTLLDLRQKQASLAKTEAGRLQANDTARQSNNIYVFTLVTIFFLPLSWLTSLFALNVTTFPRNGETIEYQPHWLFPILFGVTGVFFAIAIFAPLRVDAFQDWMYNRNKGGNADRRKPPTRLPPVNSSASSSLSTYTGDEDDSSSYIHSEDYDERTRKGVRARLQRYWQRHAQRSGSRV